MFIVELLIREWRCQTASGLLIATKSNHNSELVGVGQEKSASTHRRFHELPIMIPVRKTKSPPNPTCRAADRGGVSM